MSEKNIVRVAPVLFVKDINGSIDFYQNKLGFKCTFKEEDEENPIYAVLIREGIEIHLSPRKPEWAGHGQYHFLVMDADSLYKEFTENGVKMISEIEDRDYEMRAFYFNDLDGNFIEVGHNL